MSSRSWRRVRVIAVPVLLVATVATGCARTLPGTGRAAPAVVASAAAASSAAAAKSAVDSLVSSARDCVGVVYHGITLTGSTQLQDVVVHVSSKVGRQAGTDLQAGTATVRIGGITLQVVQVDEQAWVQAPAAFWQGVVEAPAVAPDSNAWVVLHDVFDFPAMYASRRGIEGLVLPASDATVTKAGETTVDGRPATVLTDDDDWKYDVVSRDDYTGVAHAEHEADSYDLEYSDDAEIDVATPPAALVVSVEGF